MAPGGKRATLPAVIAFLFRPMRLGKLFGIPFRGVPAVVNDVEVAELVENGVTRLDN